MTQAGSPLTTLQQNEVPEGQSKNNTSYKIFKAEVALTLPSHLTCCFSLCISARLFISKLQKIRLLMIHTRFLKKYFQVYTQAVGNIALMFFVNAGLN
jgi:hypothetical protein